MGGARPSSQHDFFIHRRLPATPETTLTSNDDDSIFLTTGGPVVALIFPGDGDPSAAATISAESGVWRQHAWLTNTRRLFFPGAEFPTTAGDFSAVTSGVDDLLCSARPGRQHRRAASPTMTAVAHHSSAESGCSNIFRRHFLPVTTRTIDREGIDRLEREGGKRIELDTEDSCLTLWTVSSFPSEFLRYQWQT